MIVDSHLHVWGRTWHPDWLWEFFRKHVDFGKGMSEARFENEFVPEYCDPTGEKLVAEMDRAGTDRALLLCIDWNLVDPAMEAKLTIREQNRAHAEICRNYPDRVAFGVGVDPRRADALDILEEGVTQLGARVVKFYPPAGFYPSDRAFYPFYEKCCELGVPILSHSGPVMVHKLRMKYSHPLHWNDVAVDLPDLKIILAHCSLHWWRDCLGVVALFDNMYIDLSWFANIVHPESFGVEGAYEHERALGTPPSRAALWRHVREIFNLLPGRIMYGSDYNGLPGVQQAHVKLYSSWRDAEREAGVRFTQDEMDDFFWRTAERIYGWPDRTEEADAAAAGSVAAQ
jgi:uncharacterized protein